MQYKLEGKMSRRFADWDNSKFKIQNTFSLRLRLYKYPGTRARIALPEIFGCSAFFLFEDAVKIGNVIKPAVVSDFCNRLRSIDQHS